jgi:hypothetical protein
MVPAAPRNKRILLGHLAARGDCLYATAVARQIKTDFPGCHLTWAIGSLCRPLLDGNPYVDAVWEIPLDDHARAAEAWYRFAAEAQTRFSAGEFDEAFFTQIHPANFSRYDGTVRASIFRGYPRPITVPVAPVIRLNDAEIENVRRFAQTHDLAGHDPVILFECMHSSAQSFIDSAFVYRAIDGLVAKLPHCRIILSSHMAINTGHPAVISGDKLTFRENAELTKCCSLMIGCSSGITWLCTSDWAKPLPMIQLLKQDTGVYASVTHDHDHFGLPADHVIELTDCPADHLVDCVVTAVREGVGAARRRFHRNLPLCFDFYKPTLDFLVGHGGRRDALKSCATILRRYGPRPAVIALILRTLFTIAKSAGVKKAAGAP